MTTTEVQEVRPLTIADEELPEFIEKVNFEVEFITPEYAGYVLEEKNPGNRRIRTQHVRNLVAAMLSDDFYFTGEPAIFDEDGNLIDAQHRLTAIKASNKPQWMLVVRGVSRKAIEYIDRGAPRTLGEVLRIRGYSHGQETATANLISTYWKYENINARGHDMTIGQKYRTKPTDSEQANFYEQDADAINLAVERAKGIPTSVLSPAIARLVSYLLPRVDEGLAATFLDGLMNGTTAEDGNIHLLRERLIVENSDDRLPPSKRSARSLWAVCAVWNATREGRELQRVLIPRDIRKNEYPALV